MRKITVLTVIFSLLFAATAFAQEENVKVKKVKNTRMGLVVTGGPVWYSLDNYKCTGCKKIGGGFALTTPIKPSDIECPWYFNFGCNILDVNMCNVDLGNRHSDSESILMIEMFPFLLGADYVFNPLSAGGKFKAYAQGRLSFLAIGVPSVESSKKSSYKTLKTDAFGLGIGAEIGLKYGWQHFEVGVGAFVGVNAVYSESSGSFTNKGVAASLYYYF